MRFLWLLLLPCLAFAKGTYTTPEFDELRIELEDLKHALKTSQVEFGLLEERVKKQDKPQNKELLATLERKLTNLEKTLDKAVQDLRSLSSKIQMLESEIASHEKKLEEVVKLKGTLTSISKAISPAPSQAKSYRVIAGDSLEKIARKYGTTAEILRKLNNLSNDKIVVGQNLKVPDDAP